MGEFVENYTFLNKIPILGGILRNFDKTVEEKGFQPAMVDFLEKHECKLTINGRSGKTDNVLNNHPLVITANHPFDFDMGPLIAALPARDDISIIIASEFMGIGPNTDKHFIPVFINRYLNKFHIYKIFHIGPVLVNEQEHKRNIESIQNAALRVKNGGIVIIFPCGVRKSEINWFPGIGYLLKDIGKTTKAYYLKAYIKGTSNLDLLRLIPGIRRLLPSLKVSFSESEEISSILEKSDNPENITKDLQKNYIEWVETLK